MKNNMKKLLPLPCSKEVWMDTLYKQLAVCARGASTEDYTNNLTSYFYACGVDAAICQEIAFNSLLFEQALTRTTDVLQTPVSQEVLNDYRKRMESAWDNLAKAYIATFVALGRVITDTHDVFGELPLPSNNQNYLDSFFMGRLHGYSALPPEEKRIQQFIARGNLAQVPLKDAEQL